MAESRIELIDPGLIAAARKFSDWAESQKYTSKAMPVWYFVYTDPDTRQQSAWSLPRTLRLVASLLEQNEVSHLKLRHIERLMGREWLSRILKDTP